MEVRASNADRLSLQCRDEIANRGERRLVGDVRRMGRDRELDRPVAGIVAAQLRSDFAQLTDKDFLHLRMEMGLGLLNEDQLDYRRLHRSTEAAVRSEEHTSELQSLMRISYAVFCLKKKIQAELN